MLESVLVAELARAQVLKLPSEVWRLRLLRVLETVLVAELARVQALETSARSLATPATWVLESAARSRATPATWVLQSVLVAELARVQVWKTSARSLATPPTWVLAIGHLPFAISDIHQMPQFLIRNSVKCMTTAIHHRHNHVNASEPVTLNRLV